MFTALTVNVPSWLDGCDGEGSGVSGVSGVGGVPVSSPAARIVKLACSPVTLAVTLSWDAPMKLIETYVSGVLPETTERALSAVFEDNSLTLRGG